MIVICTILFIADMGGVRWQSQLDIEGIVKSSSDTKYVVDFSEDIKKYKSLGNPSDYKSVLIYKSNCVTK